MLNCLVDKLFVLLLIVDVRTWKLFLRWTNLAVVYWLLLGVAINPCTPIANLRMSWLTRSW